MTLGTNIKIAWIAGMPRAGSMWAFNVTRALAESAGCKALPEHNHAAEDRKFAEANRALQDKDPAKVWVLKVHRLLRADVPLSRIIVPRRDPRDALMSYMRFTKCDFETALRVAQESAVQNAVYDKYPKTIILKLDYADITGEPDAVVRRIAEFLDIAVSPETITGIVGTLSRERVAELILNKEQDIAQREMEGRFVSPDEIVQSGAGNRRYRDVETGFQSGHVSGYQDGGWRLMLSAAQLRRLEDVMGDALKAWDKRRPGGD